MEIEFNEDGSIKLPEKIVKNREEIAKKEKIKKFNEDYWERINFDTKSFFEDNEYLGCFKSKRNWYYVYQYDKFYVVSTGIKEITRFNILFDKEIEYIKKIIEDNFQRKYFKLNELMDVVKKSELNPERILFHSENHLEDLHFNDFYNILLQACYVLTVKNELVFDKLGKNVIFALNYHNKKLDKRPNIFEKIEFIKSTERSLIFKNNKYYFDVRCKDFRGSIFPYLINEIEYMKKIIQNSSENQLNVEKIMKQMEYEQRFHDIYQMIIDKNIRNDRNVFDFFVSRVKSALRIIATITDLVEIEKEGRGNIFLRRI